MSSALQNIVISAGFCCDGGVVRIARNGGPRPSSLPNLAGTCKASASSAMHLDALHCWWHIGVTGART